MILFLSGICKVSHASTTPVITHVNAIEVDGTPVTSNSATILFSGTATAGDEIKLYSAFGLAGSTNTLGNGTWSFTASNIMDGGHSFTAVIEDWPRTALVSSSVSVNVDTSASAEDPGYTFLINRRADGSPETSTSSINVKVSLFTNDSEGIASARISNDGIFWQTWNAPAPAPDTHDWALENSAGIATIYMKFYDADANESAVITRQIGYYPVAAGHTGSAAGQTYPSATYDEYQGENKYGSSRIDVSQPETGTSLKLVTP